jgi:hypothetical protein
MKKKQVWASVLLVVLVAIAALWVFRGSWLQPSETVFRLVSLKDNNVLLSDSDVLSYNLTSQEIALTDAASQRLMQTGDTLYSFSPGVAIRINGEEIYQCVFRLNTMSALPTPPKISILFPSTLLQSDTTNEHALRMFFPAFEPPSDQTVQNSKFVQYFEEANKLIH